MLAELFGRGERQLERRAFHMIDEDVQVVGIDQRPLWRRVKEVLRVPDHELIERRAAATITAADRPARRPARPARCHVAAIVPG